VSVCVWVCVCVSVCVREREWVTCLRNECVWMNKRMKELTLAKNSIKFNQLISVWQPCEFDCLSYFAKSLSCGRGLTHFIDLYVWKCCSILITFLLTIFVSWVLNHLFFVVYDVSQNMILLFVYSKIIRGNYPGTLQIKICDYPENDFRQVCCSFHWPIVRHFNDCIPFQ